jgi:acetolactate synthase I/II/III large subunit
MAKREPSVERRTFLKTALTGAVSIAAPIGGAEVDAQAQSPAQPTRSVPVAPPQPEADPPAESSALTVDRTGSDFMTDVIKSLGFEYIFANPGDKFRAFQESLTGPYGGNKNPEWITCLHEDTSVGMAHGYTKMEGKPICVFAHGTVGLQHAAMAIYNAYCDRVPVFLVVGNSLDISDNHAVQDAAAMVRDFIRWDDTPITLHRFAESAVRAYKSAMTPPMMPVLLVADSEMQERPMPAGPEPVIPKITIAQPPQGDAGAIKEAARLLVSAENPVIVVDKYARSQAGVDRLVELAELLQAAVVDQAGRMNFPNRHPLNQSFSRPSPQASADVILGLEVSSLYRPVHASRNRSIKTISIGADELFTKSNYQDTGRFQSIDVDIAADAENSLPALIEAVQHAITADRKSFFQARGAKLAAAQKAAFEQARLDATYAWDASPVSTGRLSAEIWEAVKGEDWSFVSYIMHFSWWPLRTWPMEKRYHFNGGTGGNGMGYNAPAALGAALANKKHGRFTVNVQGDGDLMYAPGVLWTAAHHQIPILNVMHNNRAYHQELMHLQRMACRHSRGLEQVGIGVKIENPDIDYAKMAQSMGVYAEGPITNPKDVGPALRRAVAVVRRGEPALLDVVSQPR